MGLLKLLALPLLGPCEGLAWIAGKVAEQAERELFNEPAVRGQLMELELQRDMGEITEEEYLASEQVLLLWLEAIHEYSDSPHDTDEGDDHF